MRSLPIFANIVEQTLDRLIDVADRHVFYETATLSHRYLTPGTVVVLIRGSVLLAKPGMLGMITDVQQGSIIGLTEASVGESLIWEVKVNTCPTVLYTIQYKVSVVHDIDAC
jgi:hypothetical protein